jgi:Tfp pilus assembly protein PilN
MRYDINLATRPYIDARRFYTNWLAVLVPLFLVAALLVGYAVRGLAQSRGVTAKVGELDARIAELDRARARAQEVMDRPENRDTREKSQFLNAVITRKAFSWTQVFMELERIVPPRVHVLGIHPEIKDGRVQIVMVVAGASREDAVELLRRMEASENFRQPQLRSEDVKQTPGGSAQVEFEVAAIYVQGAPPVAAAPPAKGGN